MAHVRAMIVIGAAAAEIVFICLGVQITRGMIILWLSALIMQSGVVWWQAREIRTSTLLVNELLRLHNLLMASLDQVRRFIS